MLGWSELLVIFSVVIVAWNFHRLPELVQAGYEAIKAFKSELQSGPNARDVNECKPAKLRNNLPNNLIEEKANV